MEYVTLSNDVKIPQLGFGVFLIPKDQTKEVVLNAIDVGYRHFDTAQAYYNEEAVGEAIEESGIPREEFFITTKVWVSSYGYEETKKAFEESLSKLRTDYIDLYLIHQNVGDTYATWRAMEDLYKEMSVIAEQSKSNNAHFMPLSFSSYCQNFLCLSLQNHNRSCTLFFLYLQHILRVYFLNL